MKHTLQAAPSGCREVGCSTGHTRSYGLLKPESTCAHGQQQQTAEACVVSMDASRDMPEHKQHQACAGEIRAEVMTSNRVADAANKMTTSCIQLLTCQGRR
jgi:hypothetical protein